jgi:hypothetical protein
VPTQLSIHQWKLNDLETTFRSKLVSFTLVATFSSCSVVMLFQSYTVALQTTFYYLCVSIFIGAIALSLFLASELVTISGIFFFSLILRLMYFLRTNFVVFPTGDPYSQYSVLRFFSLSSHVSLFPSSNFLNFLTQIPNQYSEWPGFQTFALAFVRVTGIPMFLSALVVIPFMMFCLWFLLSYLIARMIFGKIPSGKISIILVVASLTIASFQPRFEIPPIFKYDFFALLFLTAGLLVVLSSFNFHREIGKNFLLLIIFSILIIVSHNLTAIFWVLIFVLFSVGVLFSSKLFSILPSNQFIRSIFQIRTRSFQPRRNLLLVRLPVFIGAITILWWTFYAKFVISYSKDVGPFILKSFSFHSLSTSRVSKAAGAVVSRITPEWLLHALNYRDYIFLGLVALGTLVLFVRPSFLGRMTTILLLSIIVVTIPFELFGALNFNDRPFLTFSTFLGLIAVIPLVALTRYKISIAKVGAVIIVLLFLSTAALGFWGSSYAPAYLYSNATSPSALGEHPTNWPAVASYMNYDAALSSSHSCIVSNEMYVTSLALPLASFIHTFPYTDIRIAPGCLGIIYESPSSFNSSIYAEPYHPYNRAPGLPRFSYNAFVDRMSKSDVIFATENVTIYYFQVP